MKALATDLELLTGVRSGKRTYYREYQRSNERLQRTVTAMESISRALVRTTEGPRSLFEEVTLVAAEHVQATWMMIALADGALPDARPRFLVLDPDGNAHVSASRLPRDARLELARIRAGQGDASVASDPSWVRVPMLLDGQLVGGLAGLQHLEELEAADLSVLRILASQCATSLHATELYQSTMAQQSRAHQLLDEVSHQARVLAGRTEELRAAEQRLRVADQRELLESERRRIALELHDSVAQTVLTAGLSVDLLRGEAAAVSDGGHLVEELDRVKGLMVVATEQLRSAIYALHHARSADDVASLPELLAEVAAQHRPHLAVVLRVEGRPFPLGAGTDHALARTAGEALFNVAMHANATRALVRLRYLADAVVLRISDDGEGDPVALRRTVRVARRGAADGRHRGLVGMALRAEGLGGSMSIRRSRAGGICIESTIPVRSSSTCGQEGEP